MRRSQQGEATLYTTVLLLQLDKGFSSNDYYLRLLYILIYCLCSYNITYLELLCDYFALTNMDDKDFIARFSVY